jgi:hypothetical protein
VSGASFVRRSVAPLVGVLFSGCVRQEPAGLPPLEGHRALILLAATEGAVAGAAADIRSGVAVPLVLDLGRDSQVFALFYDAPLSDLGLAQGPLTLQKNCGRELPDAVKTFRAGISSGSISPWTEQPTLPTSIADLKLATASKTCPTLIDPAHRYLVDLECTSSQGMPLAEPLGSTVDVAQMGCELSITSFMGELRGVVSAPQGACFPRSDNLGACRTSQATADGVLRVDCTSDSGDVCTIRIYRREETEPFDVRSVALFGDVPLPEMRAFERPPRGYIGGLAMLDGRIAVATYGGADRAWRCGDTDPSRIYLLDQETLATIATATAPPCLSQIVGAEDGGSFFGAYGSAVPEIARFDRDGRRRGRTAFTLPSHDPRLQYFPSSIAIGGHRTVAVTMTVADISHVDGQMTPGFVLAVATEDLSPRAFDGTYHSLIRAIAPFDSAHFIAIDDATQSLVFIDVDDGEQTTAVQVASVQLQNHGYLGQVIRHESSDRLLLTITSETGGVYVFDANRRFLGRAGNFAMMTDAFAMITWPADPSKVLVGVSESEDHGSFTGSLAIVDVAGVRLLPESQVIGVGPIGRMARDAKGRVWAPLPWTGRVVRIGPR